MKTKEFLVLVKTKIHQKFNKMIIQQFSFGAKYSEMAIPPICGGSKSLSEMIGTEAKDTAEVQFRYYTDTTGNNHHLVRQILKRRAWLQRIDTI